MNDKIINKGGVDAMAFTVGCGKIISQEFFCQLKR
jgi:hypothetical protein